MLAEQLVQAECEIVLGVSIIECQRGVVGKRRRKGLDLSDSIALLTWLEELQAIHVAERDRLRAKLAALDPRVAARNAL